MTIPYQANGAPAPGQPQIPMPPGVATYNTPMPAMPAQVQPAEQWRGYPASALPPALQVGPQPGQNQGAPVQQPQYQQPTPQQPGQYQIGQPVPTQFAQPQVQPGQQFVPGGAPQQPVDIPPGISPNTILQGPNFPPELQGVSLGQAIQMYGGMRQLILGLQQRAAQQVQAPAPGGQPIPAPAAAPAPAQQPGQAPAFDWRNPAASIAAVVGPLLDERINQAMAPMNQQAQLAGAAQARAAVMQEVGAQRFAQIEPMIIGLLQGATPQDLANPDLWRTAMYTAIGRQSIQGQPQQQQNGRQPVGPQYGGAVPFQPGMQNPAPSLASFFTEQPQAGGQSVQGVTLSAAQMWFADQMGVPRDIYAAYSQGVPAVLPGGVR